MAKKGKKEVESKKTKKKADNALIENNTFGLKNKNKSKKVQNHIQQITAQVRMKGKDGKTKSRVFAQQEEAAKLKADKHAAALKQMLRASIKQPPCPEGVDPKTIMCALHMHGLCKKGDKCKFSHDKAANAPQRKKRDIHQDDRDDHSNCTLEEAVAAIQNRDSRSTQNKSERVCRFFLEAIEQEKIGYFWECPNVIRFGHCKYRHALPAGFILKSEATAQRISANTRDLDNHELEDEIELKRSQITNGTPVTPETFAAWKAARIIKKEADLAKASKDKDEEARRAGIVRQFLGVTGSKMFELDPSMFEEPEEEEEDKEEEALAEIEAQVEAEIAAEAEAPASLDAGVVA